MYGLFIFGLNSYNEKKNNKVYNKKQNWDRSNPILSSLCSSTLALIIQITGNFALALRSIPTFSDLI